MQSRPRFTRKQLQLLAIGWMVLVCVVGACTFGGIWLALSRSEEADTSSATVPTVPPTSLPTPLPVDPPVAGGGDGGGGDTPAAAPTLIPREDKSFGYGIQAQLLYNTGQTADIAEQLGMNWVKQQVRWRDYETQPGQINTEWANIVFEALHGKNVKLMISVVDAPDWARPSSVPGTIGPPEDYQALANFIVLLLQRYPGSIHAVEVWNEENLRAEWDAPGGISARDYVTMLGVVSNAIRQTDPGVIVISGALAPTGVNNAEAQIDLNYMQEMIDAGLLNYVDCVGAHANGYNVPPNVAFDAGYQDPTASFRGPFDNPHYSFFFYSTLTGYNDLIVRAGQSTPLCVTEFGWATTEDQDIDIPNFGFANDNTLEEQANNIVAAYQIMHDWDFVWLSFLFNLDEVQKGGYGISNGAYSLVDKNGVPRPAFDAVRDMPKPP